MPRETERQFHPDPDAGTPSLGGRAIGHGGPHQLPLEDGEDTQAIAQQRVKWNGKTVNLYTREDGAWAVSTSRKPDGVLVWHHESLRPTTGE